jgi:hypothetical protein
MAVVVLRAALFVAVTAAVAVSATGRRISGTDAAAFPHPSVAAAEQPWRSAPLPDVDCAMRTLAYEYALALMPHRSPLSGAIKHVGRVKTVTTTKTSRMTIEHDDDRGGCCDENDDEDDHNDDDDDDDDDDEDDDDDDDDRGHED